VSAEERDAWLLERLFVVRELASAPTCDVVDVKAEASVGFLVFMLEIFMDQFAFCSVIRDERRDRDRSAVLP